MTAALNFALAGNALSDFGSAASLFGAAGAAGASIAGYYAQAGAYDTQATSYDLASDTAKSNARLSKVAAEIQQTQTERQIYQVVGGAKADIAGAGLAEKGSALDVIRSSQEQGALQLHLMQTQGTIQQAAFAQQASAYSAEGEGARASAASARGAAAGAAASSTANKVGGVLSALGGIASIATLFALCWVAREVYGEDDPRWREMRDFIINYGPDWFRALYEKHGEAFAGFLRAHPRLKPPVRLIFDGCRAYRRLALKWELIHA